MDLLESPQTQLFPYCTGTVAITVSVSDNTVLGFRRAPSKQNLPGAVFGEVYAGPRDEPVTLRLKVEGLPEGKVLITSYHHCFKDGVNLPPVQISLNAESSDTAEISQTSGSSPNFIDGYSFSVAIKPDIPLEITYEAPRGPVVLNRLIIARETICE